LEALLLIGLRDLAGLAGLLAGRLKDNGLDSNLAIFDDKGVSA
jgi:hypothetical protein